MVLWVFGYGSLIWNPGFDFDEKIMGFIKGYKRTFNLACIDHRGTPKDPARTCTLESEEEAVCWGIAYCVNGGLEKEREAMQYLERRECEYDQKISVNFYKDGNSLEPCVTGVLVFVSTPDPVGNKYYLGPAPLEDMARQIATLVGTDEMTTCVGVVIRNNKTGMTSVSHMDFPKIVDGGFKQMLELLGDDNAPFDVHLIGGFDDASTKVVHSSEGKRSKQEGYSHPLCCKIIEVLHKSEQQFHLRSFCVLGNNTMTDSYGNARPIVGGFVMQTSSGVVTPASFDMASRAPDEIVRRIRVSVSSYDPSWKGRLLETYDTHADIFQIAPACWMPDWAEIASSLNELSDSEILLQCSTSPAAEPPHFVETERRIWKYLMENPDWEDTFPTYKPRVFHWTNDGRWSRHS